VNSREYTDDIEQGRILYFVPALRTVVVAYIELRSTDPGTAAGGLSKFGDRGEEAGAGTRPNLAAAAQPGPEQRRARRRRQGGRSKDRRTLAMAAPAPSP
jgi:hypothetical protein